MFTLKRVSHASFDGFRVMLRKLRTQGAKKDEKARDLARGWRQMSEARELQLDSCRAAFKLSLIDAIFANDCPQLVRCTSSSSRSSIGLHFPNIPSKKSVHRNGDCRYLREARTTA